MKTFKDFITKEEQEELLTWSKSVRPFLRPNATPNRFYRFLNVIPKIPLVGVIEQRILESYNLQDTPKEDGRLGSLLSWHQTGGAVHEHNDDFNTGKRHIRFNLFLSKPDSGGAPIYDGKELEFEERMLIPYEADKFFHSSTPVVGVKPRIIISYGWQFEHET